MVLLPPPTQENTMFRLLYLFCFFASISNVCLATQEVASNLVQEYGDRLDRIYDATVRVSVSGGTGTGTIFKEDGQFYYILTNAHVATANKVGLEFTKNHYPSPRYQGEVTFRVLRSGVDVAVVRIAKGALPAGIDLPVIPLATADQVSKELLLVTSGCQAGERPSVQNTLTTRDTSNLIYYLPTSRPGRSGSSLVSRDGKTIQGLVAWMTDRGPNSEGLAMKVDVIRPLIEGGNTIVADEDFPMDAVQIPLGSGEYVETELSTLNECHPDSCLDDNCPWDYEYVGNLSAANDPWRRRFGGPTQPQPSSPTQPSPQEPSVPKIPDNPWQSPREQPRQDTPPSPQPQPQPKPEPKQDRPRLFDSEREFGKLFERFDRLEPKIDRLGEELKKKQEEELEESQRRQRLFDRMESLPDHLIGPDDLNQFAERQSNSLIERLRNLVWTLLQPFVWAWWIALTIGIMWGLNTILSPLRPDWLAALFLWIVSIVRMFVSAVMQAWNSAWKPLQQPSPTKRPSKPRAKKAPGKVVK